MAFLSPLPFNFRLERGRKKNGGRTRARGEGGRGKLKTRGKSKISYFKEKTQ